MKESTGSADSDVKTKIFSLLDDLQNTGFNVLLQPLFQELQVFLQIFTIKLLTELIQDPLLPETKHKMKLAFFIQRR